MIKRRSIGYVYLGTQAELLAETAKRKAGEISIPTDANEARIHDGVNRYSLLKPIPKMAAFVANLETPVALSAIPGAFGDLAAARTAVNTLRSEVTTRLAALETSHSALLATLKTSKAVDAVDPED